MPGSEMHPEMCSSSDCLSERKFSQGELGGGKKGPVCLLKRASRLPILGGVLGAERAPRGGGELKEAGLLLSYRC